MANQERILTDVGISLPRMSKWERFVIKQISGVGKRIVRVGLSLSGNKDLIESVNELFDGVKTLVEVADDFESGRISGKVVTTVPQVQLDGGFDHHLLIKARQEAKRRKKRLI